jgi:micrococcal nuclease
MYKNFKLTILAFVFLLISPQNVFAHSGRTDANGCHTNRKTGGYHCHNESAVIKIKEARIEARESVNMQARSESSTETTQPANIEEKFLVSRVIDGDTIELVGGNKVRYIGIDTPETLDPRKPVQCFGKEASVKNKELVEGKMVRLEKDITDKDQYGRLLRYVYVDNIFINLELVKQGYAYTYSYSPDIKYQDKFTKAQKIAKENNFGLWSGCNSESNYLK